MKTIRLEANGPLEPAPVRAMLAAHAVPGGQSFDPATGAYTRLLRVNGRLRPVTVRPERTGVTVETDTVPPAEVEVVKRLVRLWFDLDRDPVPVTDRLGEDPLLAPLVKRRPGLRVTREPEGFEAAIGTVLGQQVSVARGRVFGSRLLELCGDPAPGGLIAFPAPDRLAAEPFERLRGTLGLTGARARTVLAVARLFADGFRLGPEVEPQAARKRLLELPGVGPWTVEYLAMRVLGDPDAFPPGDAVLRRALGGVTDREAATRSAAWSPWRSYAAAHLWAEAAYGDPA